MRPRTVTWLVIVALLTALAVRLYLRSSSRKRPGSPPVAPAKNRPPVPVTPGDSSQAKAKAPPQPAVPPTPAEPGELRFADDAENKSGDFWLEQALEVTGAPTEGAARGDLLDLYVSLDPKSQAGIRARLKAGEISLEQVSAPGAAPVVLAKGALRRLIAGETVLGVLWRRGELSVWYGPQEVLKWTPPAAQASGLRGPSAVQVLGRGLRLGARRALALDAIRFDDSFMRDAANGAWRPLAGKWELTALAFPERSANPFSMRASSGGEEPADDPLYRGRIKENDYGLGIILSPYEGTLHIERITGGSPAARAGLAEDDIFLSVNGMPIDGPENAWQVHQWLLRGYGGDVQLRMLRPGEKTARDFRITREHFRWGMPMEGIAVQPVLEPQTIGADRVALIAAGEAGWSEYAAEVAVKALGSGGMGLAVGVTSPEDYLVFRWRGPAERQAPAADPPFASPFGKGAPPGGASGAGVPARDRLQLVRVKEGRETVLAERAAGYRPYEFYRLGVDWRGDKITCTVDGNEVLSAAAPDLKRGQIALYALRGEPVFFDDMRVYSDRTALETARHPERALNQIFAAEENMEAWGNPALEWDRDLKTGWAVHKQRFPGEQAVVLNKPRFDELTVALGCEKDPERAGGVLTIKDGVAQLHGFGWQGAETLVGKGPFQRIAFRWGAFTGAEADIDGKQLYAPRVLTMNLLSMKPLAQIRIAIRGLKNLGDPNTVRVSSSNLLEYTFNSAPTDWKVECGRWGLLNKWICDPRWSWFGGRTRTLAALWNKYVFSGDISVDAHVALMMQHEDPPFERPGDYNLAICGDGVNLDSGYLLIFGGDNNLWTRLYRKGKLVAESTKEEHRVFSDRIRHPDKPELHQRWFNLKLEKIGNTISFYRDGALAFSFVDPEPLNEGRVGFWTVDNGFLLSRMRIAHNGAKPAPFEPRRSALFQDSRVINMFDGEVWSSVEPQVLPPAIEAALASPKDAFQPVDAEPLVGEGLAMKGAPAYRVVNATGGGPFALQWRSLAIDPDNRGVLRFAYRIEPGAQVDLYLYAIDPGGAMALDPRRQGAYRWRLTGPRESDEHAPLVGEVPNAQADGRWHAVQFDLNPSWRALWQARGFGRPGRQIFRLMFGNLDNHGYLLAGLNGNHAGDAFSVSDVMALAPRDIDHAPPKVARVIWPYDKDGDGRSLSVLFDDGGGAGIADESLQLNVNGAGIFRPVSEFDHLRQTLRVDLLKLNLPPLAQNPTLELKLLGFQDRAQNPSAGGFSASFTFDTAAAAKAAKPAASPVVNIVMAGNPEIIPGRAALAHAETSPVAPVARIQESAGAPPWAPWDQKRSVQVVNVNDGSAFGFTINNAVYNLRYWPYLQIDYKIPAETPVNLHFSDQAGSQHALMLTDVGDYRDPYSREINYHAGPPADFIADGTWRRSVAPLQQLFAKVNPQIAFTDVRGFSLHDNGWRGNRRAMEYWIHRVQPLPAGRAADFAFTWQAADLSGISDFASCIDQFPETDPAGKQEVASGDTLADVIARNGAPASSRPDGWNYLHLRVKNGAGQWSPAVHTRFYLDNAPPKVARTEPAAGATAAGQTIKLFLDEPHGVDLSMLRVTVNSRPVGPRGLEFDAALNRITYNAALARAPWPDGKVSVVVYGLRDLLGNQASLPFSFSFNASQAEDKTGPAIAQARYVPQPATFGRVPNRQMDMEISFALNFEEHTGHVHAIRDCSMEWLDDPASVCFGRRAVRFTALDDDADAQITLHKNAWWLDLAPVLHFDYKADPGMKVDLLILVLGQWLSVRFTGDGAAPAGGKNIGQVESIVADGTWRHASVDLRGLIDAAWPDLPVRIVNKINLSAQGRGGSKRGAALTLDNVDLTRGRGGGGMGGGHFEWRAEADPSGIEGYSFALDRAPDTIAPETVNMWAASSYAGGRAGVWYAHIRARDQAGNWGPTRTVRVDFGN